MTTRISRYVLFLAALSGVCGISYEILYTRAISSYFGDIFYIAAATLIGFLVSLALGALLAHRYVRSLPYIEIAIGAYGLLAAYIFSNHAVEIVRTVSSFGAFDTMIAFVASVIALLFIPALLIGFSVPIFAIYLSYYRPRDDTSAGFRHVYLFYNIGAALSVLALEFYIIHFHGITASITFIALLNLIVGILLLRIKAPQAGAVSSEARVQERLSLQRRYGLALLIVSIASGIFQLLFLKLSHRIFGPLNENFAIVLAAVFIGIAVGTLMVGRYRMRLPEFFLVGAVIVAGTFALATPIIHVWAQAQELFAIEMGLSALLKTVLMVLWGIAGFAFFGATIPAVLRHRQGNYVLSPGRALAISAFGNSLGFVVIVLLLHWQMGFSGVAVVSAAFAALAAFVVWERSDVSYAPMVAYVMACGILTSVLVAEWPSEELRLGYRTLSQPQKIADMHARITHTKTFRSFGDEVHVFYDNAGGQFLSHNGYLSLGLGYNGDITAFRETLVGITGALFSERRDRALVLGLGTGITAGAASELYARTDVAEVIPAMVPAVSEFSKQNFGVLDKETVTVELQDGMVKLMTGEEKYDLIVNTVSSPVYFSAGKLWTRDALLLIRDRLTPGGVFSAWFDGRIGRAGTITQFKTFEDVFPHCTYFILNYQYYNVVCGTKQLVVNESVSDAWPHSIISLVELRGTKSGVTRYLLDLQIEPSEELYDAFSTDIREAAINTIDRPVLEFIGDAHRYEGDASAHAFFVRFAALSDASVSKDDKLRQCNNLLTIVRPEGFYDTFPTCYGVLQNSR